MFRNVICIILVDGFLSLVLISSGGELSISVMQGYQYRKASRKAAAAGFASIILA